MSDTRRHFHDELESLRSQIVALGASTVEAIPRATAVLLDGDLEGAEYLLAADADIDTRAREAEEECYRLLALQQPMGLDLRLIIANMKLIGEIERSADLCANICKAARRIHGHPLDPKLRGLIAMMGEHAHLLFQSAIESYAEADLATASALDDMDTLLDQTHRDFVQGILESHAVGRTDVQVAVQLGLVGRFYERIGDHAVIIGERVQYIVTGTLPPAPTQTEKDEASAF